MIIERYDRFKKIKIEIEISHLSGSINGAKNKRALRPDKTNNEHLKATAKDRVDICTFIYNKCLEHAKIADASCCSALMVA